MRCDVLVAGGGSAGLAAAVSAARCGARTLLVEQNHVLGGTSAAALVHTICGLYELAAEAAPVWANPGFATEFAERLARSGGARGPVRMGRVHVLLHDPAAFARVATALARETPDLEVRLDATITAADRDLSSVDLAEKSGRHTVRPTVVVDATGDAALAALAGAEFEQSPSDRLQRPAFIFALEGIAPDALSETNRLKIAARVARAVGTGVLPAAALGAALRPGSKPGEAFVTIDLAGPADYAPTDADQIAALDAEGRQLAERLADFLRAEGEGFALAAISAFPARPGIRESRRVAGEYRLETEDVQTGRKFPDAIARATWPIELRETAHGPRFRYPTGDRAADIPLRSLRALRRPNLLVAGRCLSCSHEAQASIRVMGTCFATGEAAGIAAALQATHRPADAAAVVAERERLRTP